VPVLSALAKLYLKQAAASDLFAEDRLNLVGKANKYLAVALAERPGDRDLLELRERVSVELTLARWNSTGSTIRSASRQQVDG